MKPHFYLFAILFLMSGCASRYHFIHPEHNQQGQQWVPAGEIHLEYQTEVMYLNKNKKQARKERNKNFSVISVKVQNFTERKIIIGKNTRFYSGDSPLYLYQAGDSYKLLKQKWAFHLFYLGLTPVSGTLAIGGLYAAGPIGIILGPGLAIYNSLKASHNNKKLESDLSTNSLIEREILPGESVSGLLVIDGDLSAPLNLRFIDN